MREQGVHHPRVKLVLSASRSAAGSSEMSFRPPVAIAFVCAVAGRFPWTSRSWSPTTGYQGTCNPGETNGRTAAASKPGCCGGSTSGR